MIHIMGMVIIRTMFYSGGMRVKSKSNNKGGGNSTFIIIILGLVLIIIGYIGMLFGRMIQSAISRQREYLADAAAVQYTRNPDGLAGALRKIGSSAKGAEIRDGHSMEMSHLFFASSFHTFLDKIYSTHPPIEKRIQAISPSLSADDSKREKRIHEKFQKDHIAGSLDSQRSKVSVGGHKALTPEVIVAAVGTLSAEHVSRAGKLMKDLPATLKNAAHEPLAAEALIYALILKADESGQNAIPYWLKNDLEEGMENQLNNMVTALEKGKREWYLPLAELSFPALRQMSEKQYKSFRKTVEKLVQERVNIFSFALEKLITSKLDATFSKTKEPEIRHHHLKPLGKEISVMLSSLSYVSDKNPEAAWQAGLKPIKSVMPDNVRFLKKEECGFDELDQAMNEFVASANPVKKYMLSAMIHCIAADKKMTIGEKELLRAISETIACPIPLGAMG